MSVPPFRSRAPHVARGVQGWLAIALLLIAENAWAAAGGGGGGGGGGTGSGGVGGAVSADAGAYVLTPALLGAFGLLAVWREQLARCWAATRGLTRLGSVWLGFALYGGMAYHAADLQGALFFGAPALALLGTSLGNAHPTPRRERPSPAQQLQLIALAGLSLLLAAAGLPGLGLVLAPVWLHLAVRATWGQEQARAQLWLSAATGLVALLAARAALDPWLARGMAQAVAALLAVGGADAVADGTFVLGLGPAVRITPACAGAAVWLLPGMAGALAGSLVLPSARGRAGAALALLAAAAAGNLVRISAVAAAGLWWDEAQMRALHDGLGLWCAAVVYSGFGLWLWRLRRRTPQA